MSFLVLNSSNIYNFDHLLCVKLWAGRFNVTYFIQMLEYLLCKYGYIHFIIKKTEA
jgi:hypothetical protein